MIVPGDSGGLSNPGKMAQFEKVERVIRERNLMVVKDDVPFFTTFACRLFKSNYYYMSLKLLHSEPYPGLVRRLGDAQSEFIAGLQALQMEGLMKAYPCWQEMGNTLSETTLVDVRHINPECRNLKKTFRTLDTFLIPVYVAQTHKLIADAESKIIAGKVKVLYDTMVKRFSEQIDDSVAG